MASMWVNSVPSHAINGLNGQYCDCVSNCVPYLVGKKLRIHPSIFGQHQSLCVYICI